MSRPIVSLADALRCQADLATSGMATVGMLRLLGLDVLADNRERDPEDLRDDAGRLASGAGSKPGPPAQDGQPESSQVVAPAGDTGMGGAGEPAHETPSQPAGALATRLRRLPRVRLSTAGDDAALVLPPAASAARPPEPDPLFAPTQRRAILTAAITTFVREGRLDVEAIVRTTASGRPMRRLPRLLRGTARRGVQVLVDRSEALVPFWRDQDQLVAQLRELLGKGRLEVFMFRGFPVPADSTLERVSSDDFDEDEAARELGDAAPTAAVARGAVRWRPPRPGTPVLIVSDFGIGAGVDGEGWVPVSRWERFADEMHSLGSNVIGLIPYDSARWPHRLVTRVNCIPWSERTSAGAVRRTIRRRLAQMP